MDEIALVCVVVVVNVEGVLVDAAFFFDAYYFDLPDELVDMMMSMDCCCSPLALLESEFGALDDAIEVDLNI